MYPAISKSSPSASESASDILDKHSVLISLSLSDHNMNMNSVDTIRYHTIVNIVMI